MFEHFVGVDVSKDKFNFCVTNSAGRKLAEDMCDVSDSGFEKFFSIIKTFAAVAVGLESTATYHLPLLCALLSKEIATYLITPLLVKNFARSCSLRTVKTDKIDARTISIFLNKNQAELHQASASEQDGLREMSRFRETTSREVIASKTKLKQMLTTTFPELVKKYNIFTVSMIALLEEFSSPEAIRKASRKKIEKVLDSKVKGRKTEAKAEEIKSLAEKSVGACLPSTGKAVQLQIKKLKSLLEVLKECDKELVEAVKTYSLEDFEILKSIPGIGDITAAQFIAEIGDINRFKSVRQLTAYAGTDPGISQSGNSLVQKKISKRGNASVRRVGFLMATHLIKENPVFKEYYNKKIAENMNKKKAIIAVFNKFLRCVFVMLKNKRIFVFNYS